MDDWFTYMSKTIFNYQRVTDFFFFLFLFGGGVRFTAIRFTTAFQLSVQLNNTYLITTLPASVAQLDAPSDWRP